MMVEDTEKVPYKQMPVVQIHPQQLILGIVAQWLELSPFKRQVPSSSLGDPTIF